MSGPYIPSSVDRMFAAVERVKERLLRSTAALASAGVPYAVVGGNAVAAWVESVDPAAVRNTRDVDIVIRREDLERARVALEAVGFVYRRAAAIDMFLDGPGGRARDAVHVIFAGEKVRESEPVANPEVEDSHPFEKFQVLSLRALVQIKLTAFRDKDRTHIRDLIEVGLVDSGWPGKFLLELGSRLQHILDTPEGLSMDEGQSS